MPNQRFYIYSIEGDGSALAWRLLAEGYQVVWYCEDSFMRQNLKGIVEHVVSKPRMSDVVVFDSVGAGIYADTLRNAGDAVIGANPLADRLELDRAYAMELATELEILVPPSHSFTSISEGIEFVSWSKTKRWVFKPSGNEDCSFTYCAKDETDMISMLLHFQAMLGEQCDYILQEFIEGQCISTEGWFDGEDWIAGAWNSTIEAKELLSGSIGPKTGCSWCVVRAYDEVPLLARELHLKLTDTLREACYIGPWDCNAIVTDDSHIYLLEHTPRFGYDAIEAYSSLLQMPLGEALIKLAEQDTALWPVDTSSYAAALRLSVPPYPFGNKDHPAESGLPIRFQIEDEGHLWFTGVELRKRKLVSAPSDGMIGVVVAAGFDACHTVKEIARRIAIPNLMWRDDCQASVLEANIASNLATPSTM